VKCLQSLMSRIWSVPRTWELTHWWLLELLCIYCIGKGSPLEGLFPMWGACESLVGGSHWTLKILGHPLHLISHKEWVIIYLQNIWQEMKRREKRGSNQGFLSVNLVGFESLMIFFWIYTKNLKISKIVCSHSAKIHPEKKPWTQPSIKVHNLVHRFPSWPSLAIFCSIRRHRAILTDAMPILPGVVPSSYTTKFWLCLHKLFKNISTM
jgi:hypothetical protein